jgi:hypothetical protein
MTEKFSQLTESILYCHQNELLEDDTGSAILGIFQAGVCDKTIVDMIERRVSKHKFKQAFYGGPPFKTPKLTSGDYIVGFGKSRQELRSRIQFLNAHSLTVAGSGAGKTTLSRFKILQIAKYVGGLFLFDLRKREFAVLKVELARLGIELVVLPARKLRINPLQLPRGVVVSDWIPRVADMLVEVLELPPRASKLLQAKLFPIYREFEDRKNEFPTLFDLFESIKRDKSSNHQARIAILDSLEPVLLSLGPGVLAYRYGWPSDELAKRRLVFELAGVSETDKNLLLNSLILSEFTSRIARGISNPKMDLWICLDEAQRICSSTDRTSAIADLIGLVRGTGIGLDLSVQSANGVLPQIISNTAVKVLGRCGSMADYSAAGGSMGLTAEQVRWAQMNLKPGVFIGQLGEGRWRYPFVFNIPLMKLPKGSVDTHADTDSSLNFPTVYASEFHTWGRVPEIGSASVQDATANFSKNLFDSSQEYQFCKAVVENPMGPSSSYPKLAGIRQKSAKALRERLVERKYIRPHVLDSGGRGRSSILLEPLPAGVEAVGKYEDN